MLSLGRRSRRDGDAGHRRPNGSQTRPSLLERKPGREARDNPVELVSRIEEPGAIRKKLGQCLKRQREAWIFTDRSAGKSRRRNANDDGGMAFYRQGAADGARAAMKIPFPIAVADRDNQRCTRLVVLRT